MKKLSLEELDRLSVDVYRDVSKTPVCLVLDNVRSLHNVGSAFRTADAFRVEKIYLTGITGTPPHREIEKTALGATESVSWEYIDNTLTVINALREQGYAICVVEQTTESIPLNRFTPDPSMKYCLVFGNEVHGVSNEVVETCDVALEIPQFGTKHSLNVSVCIGIVIWDIYTKKGGLP